MQKFGWRGKEIFRVNVFQMASPTCQREIDAGVSGAFSVITAVSHIEELAAVTGISKSALGSYENEDYKEISHGSLVTLAKFYGVSTDYLLCLTENRNHPNTELTELHLSDDMVELLKSGRINNRLLCEIATHKCFRKPIPFSKSKLYNRASDKSGFVGKIAVWK